MTKLKTLKDLEWPLGKLAYGATSDIINKEILRQEAIKHIKELRKGDNHDHSTCFPGSKCGWCEEDRPKVEWIKHFFNITEEHLE